jgi:hypothetical protein
MIMGHTWDYRERIKSQCLVKNCPTDTLFLLKKGNIAYTFKNVEKKYSKNTGRNLL